MNKPFNIPAGTYMEQTGCRVVFIFPLEADAEAMCDFFIKLHNDIKAGKVVYWKSEATDEKIQ